MSSRSIYLSTVSLLSIQSCLSVYLSINLTVSCFRSILSLPLWTHMRISLEEGCLKIFSILSFVFLLVFHLRRVLEISVPLGVLQRASMVEQFRLCVCVCAMWHLEIYPIQTSVLYLVLGPIYLGVTSMNDHLSLLHPSCTLPHVLVQCDTMPDF